MLDGGRFRWTRGEALQGPVFVCTRDCCLSGPGRTRRDQLGMRLLAGQGNAKALVSRLHHHKANPIVYMLCLSVGSLKLLKRLYEVII
jgi:hypothetical protein